MDLLIGKKKTAILSYRRKLVYYYLSKLFVIIGKNSSAFNYVCPRVKQQTNAD